MTDTRNREPNVTLSASEDVRPIVREKYGAIAEGKSSGCCGDGCGCGH